MNIVKRYLPKKVYDKLESLDFKNKEHLYVICDMIYRSTIYKKEDKDYSNKFMDIPKYYFRDIIVDSNSLSKSFNILLDNNIIVCDNKYSKLGGKSLGYKFNDDYISMLINVNIEKKTLSKKIILNKNQRNNLVNEELKTYRDYFINNFKIDYEKSIEYLNNWYNSSISNLNSSYVGGKWNEEWIKIVNKYNHLFISLNAINDGDLYFRKNKTNGRIDTNLTSLKSEYKKFIVSKEKLNQIDLVNSQPFILSILLSNINSSYVGGKLNNEELEKYINWTSNGIFYEMIEREYFKMSGNVLTRKEIKNMMFCIFYSRNTSYTKEKKIFTSLFPTISKYIFKEKELRHNEFSIKLQKIESEICMDIISKRLDEENIEYFTIHDAWLVKGEDINKTKKIIIEEFNKNYNKQPKLKLEKIN